VYWLYQTSFTRTNDLEIKVCSFGRRSVGDFSGAFRVGGRDWAVEDGVAEVGDEGLALATDLHEVSVVIDTDAAEEGGEELAFHGTGGC